MSLTWRTDWYMLWWKEATVSPKQLENRDMMHSHKYLFGPTVQHSSFVCTVIYVAMHLHNSLCFRRSRLNLPHLNSSTVQTELDIPLKHNQCNITHTSPKEENHKPWFCCHCDKRPERFPPSSAILDSVFWLKLQGTKFSWVKSLLKRLAICRKRVLGATVNCGLGLQFFFGFVLYTLISHFSLFMMKCYRPDLHF